MAKAQAGKKKKRRIASATFVTKLEQMRFQIQNLEAQKLIEAQRIERLKNDTALMESSAAENKATADRYSAVFASLDREKKGFEQDYAKQRTDSLAALNNKIDNIKKVDTQFTDARDVKAEEFKAAAIKITSAKREYEAAKRQYDKQQKEYQALREYQQVIESKFAELRALKGQIEKARNHKKKYFLNEDLKVLLRTTQLKPYKTFIAELTKALNSLESARESFAEKEAALGKAKVQEEILKSELEMFDSNRREKILSKL